MQNLFVKHARRLITLCISSCNLSFIQLTCLLVPQSMSYASGLARLDPVNGQSATAATQFARPTATNDL